MEHWWNNTETRKPTYLAKSLFKYHVYTTNVTCTDLILNPRLGGNRLAINHLSHFTGEILQLS